MPFFTYFAALFAIFKRTGSAFLFFLPSALGAKLTFPDLKSLSLTKIFV
jgi:hypothetical protein